MARGKRDLVALENANAVLEQGDILVMFPEGTCVKNNARVDAKKGSAMIAIGAKALVLPVRFYGFALKQMMMLC